MTRERWELYNTCTRGIEPIMRPTRIVGIKSGGDSSGV